MGGLKGQLIAQDDGPAGVQIIAIAVQAQRMGQACKAENQQDKKVAKAANAGHDGNPVV